MDLDDEEVFAALLEEEADIDAQDEEHLMVLAALAGLFASNAKPRRGGSAPGRLKAKQRHRLEGYCLLYPDYFADAPLHDEKVFRRRYRMSQKLFLGIVNSIREFNNYFKCKKDCTGILGFTSLQTCTTTMRMLAYGAPVIHWNTMDAWPSPRPLSVCTSSTGHWWQCLDLNTCDHPMLKTLFGS